MNETASERAKIVTDKKFDLESWSAKIAALIAKAERTDNEAEAATFRAAADRLMRKFQIAEEGLIAEDQTSILPVEREIHLADIDSKFHSLHLTMWAATARHCGVEYVYRYQTGGKYVATVIGYASDVRYAEFLHNSARLMMIAKLEPAVDPNKSDEDNVYALRSAGIERIRIATMIWGEGSHSNNAKVSRLYAAACAKRGEDPTVSGRQVNAKTFRTVYAESFATRYSARLREARDATDKAEGGALVLSGRAERVKEAFYKRFPQYRPAPASEPAEPTGPCPDCAKTKSKTKKCQIHRPFKWTQADEERWNRMNEGASALAGKAAGRSAADSVQIERGKREQRVETATGLYGAIEG